MKSQIKKNIYYQIANQVKMIMKDIVCNRVLSPWGPGHSGKQSKFS